MPEQNPTHGQATQTGQPANTKQKRRHYIVVVHGIGEQKLNQTTLAVVHRFAEVRQKKIRELL